jgi:small subunit ribosomal protein S15
MALTTDKKQEIISKHKTHENDTGSPEVQVGQRRALLNYLRDRHFDRYRSLIEKLGLRK